MSDRDVWTTVKLDPAFIEHVPESSSCEAYLAGDEIRVRGTNAAEVRAVSEALTRATRDYAIGEHLDKAKGLFYLIVGGVLVVALAFILAGIALVLLGATGSSDFSLFGLQMTSTNAGIVSIAFGAIVLIVLIQKAMRHIQEIVALQRDPYR